MNKGKAPHNAPPKWADRLLSLFCRGELLEEIRGDLHEFYLMEREDKTSFKANLSYWFHTLHFLRPFALKRLRQNSNTLIMYNNYFKFAWRNLIRHKGSALMNVSSLSVGIASFVFIFIYLQGELGYDRFHKDADRIYRVPIDFVYANGNRVPDATTPPALAPALKRDFAEVESTVRLYPSWGSKFLLSANEDRKFYEEGLLYTDSTFFDVFSFPVIHGDPATALNDPSQMVITRSMAMKYFGREDVLGESITFHSDENRLYQVSAVMEDVPFNSHFRFDFLARIAIDGADSHWGWYNFYTYMKLMPGVNIASLEPKLQPFYNQFTDDEVPNAIYTQALTDIHLNSHLKWELEVNGDMNNVYIFTSLAVFVLLISCLNYLNLTVAGSMRRFKEVGVRKVFGAYRSNLIGQFMVETLLTVLFSLTIGIFLAELLFANLSDLLGREVSVLEPENLKIFAVIATTTLLAGLLAGLYPALHLSSFKVAMAVKGMVNRSGKSATGLRKVLLVMQFTISAFMILGTLMVYQQLRHMQGIDKGFDSEQVLVIENAESLSSQQAFKTALNKNPMIEGAGVSSGIVGGQNWTFTVGYPESFLMNYVATDPEFLEAMGFEMVMGRNFERNRPTDAQGLTMVVNETAFKALGLKAEDIGKSLPMSEQNDSTLQNGTIIGVVRDFHFTDFKSEIKPFAFFFREEAMDNLSVKLSTTDMSETLSFIEATWTEMTAGAPLQYSFLDQHFIAHQANEKRLSSILLYLTLLAMFIAFMGMFAIVNLSLRSRKKEIAIRKVLGASVLQVSGLISGKFLMLVLLANLIASPLAYYLMQNWLNGFAYRTSPSLLIFVSATAATLLVAWFTVGGQSVRAALRNPTQNLRHE